MRRKLAILAAFALGATLNLSHAASPIAADKSKSIVELANSQQDRKQFKQAESNYQKALEINPLDTGALTGLISLYRQQGLANKVQLTIARLTQAQREVLGASLNRIESTMLQDQADIRLEKGHDDQAIRFLEQAVKVDADDPWLRYKLSLLYINRGDAARGKSQLEDFLAGHPDNPDGLYAYALFQYELGDTLGALQSLRRIEVSKRSGEMKSLHQRLLILNIQQECQTLMLAGNKEEAISLLTEAEAGSHGDETLMIPIAFGWAEVGEIKHARALYDQIRDNHPEPDIKWRVRYADFLSLTGDKFELHEELKAIVAMQNKLPAESAFADVGVNRHINDMLADIGEYELARRRVDALIVAHPDEPYLLYDGWKAAQRSGNTDLEIYYLQRLVVAEPSDYRRLYPAEYSVQDNIGIDEFGSAANIHRDWKEKKLASLIDRRARSFSSAMDMHIRTGTAGLSEIHSVEIPLEYKTPWHEDDEVLFRAYLIRLDAGKVNATNGDFGSMQFCQPSCASAPLKQEAQGVSFTAGYLRGSLRFDLGTTPQNFPVANIVGGIQYKGDLADYGYSLEASRRPITASLLSFAGTKDPNTGKVWGGVVATGGQLGLSLDDGETFGFWSSIGIHDLTGRNVQTNRRIQVMAGEQWRIINEENRRFVIGLTGMYWDFSKNAGEYTFGHGGYYSPHHYRSLSLPLTYTARSPRFSYLLRASVSASRSQTREALLYPTESSLQALAGPAAIYSEGSGGGRGYSLLAACEYQAIPRLIVGGSLALDRSDNYAPNQVLLYLRYSLDHPYAQPVFMPPEPVVPSVLIRLSQTPTRCSVS